MQYLENEVVKLRAVEFTDIDLLYKWENNTTIWQVSNTFTPYSKYIINKYLENSHLDIFESKQLRLMIDDNSELSPDKNKTVGAIDLFEFDPFNNRAGVGVLINNIENRRKSYASNALDVLIQYSFELLFLHQLYCNVVVENKISVELFKSRGFEVTGVKKEWIKASGGWLDEYTMQLINSDSMY